MSKLYELPLKVLWIWNCNEAEIAVDFYLTDDEGVTHYARTLDEHNANVFKYLR
jgi:hypothetical protein